MPQPNNGLSQYLVPSLLGLVIALLVIIAKPEWFPALSEHSNSFTQTSNNSSVLGQVSYSGAVEKAAPAVVNIFTQRLVQQQQHP